MAVSTVTSLNSLFNTIFDDAIFVAREVNLMAGLVTNMTATGMQNRQLGIYPQLTAQTKAEGTDYSNAIEWTKTSQMTLTPKVEFVQVVLTDERRATDPDDARQDASFEAGGAIGTKIDSDLVDLFANFSTSKGTAGNPLTITNCAAAVSVLRNQNAPNPLWVVLHPYQWHDIWVELGQPGANQAFLGDTANEAMRSFFVGQFLNAAWFADSNITIDASDDVDGAVFHRQALALDTRQAPQMEPERDASMLAWELNFHVWYGVAERRDNFGVRLISDATEPT